MINEWPFVTVTVVTVIFLRVSFFLFIYITIYILDIYKDYKGSIYRIFLIVTTVTVTLGRLLTLYKALECLTQFVANADGVAVNAEVLVYSQRLEVQAKRTIVTAGDGDVLACIDARVALHGPGQRLDEREVLVVAEAVNVHIAAQNARVVLRGLHDAVAAEDGLQVTAKNRVLKHCCCSFREKTSVSHEEPYRPTGK